MFAIFESYKLFKGFLLQPAKCDEKVKARKAHLLKEELPMAIAMLAAERSKDPKTQVGSCIVDDDFRIIGYGYNGHPLGTNSDDRFTWDKDGKHLYVCHAERNAVDFRTASVKGATLFVTLYPCNECAKTIVQNKIKRVVYMDKKDSPNIKLSDSMYILENGLPEKPIQFHEYLKQTIGTKKAKRGFEIKDLNRMFHDKSNGSK